MLIINWLTSGHHSTKSLTARCHWVFVHSFGTLLFKIQCVVGVCRPLPHVACACTVNLFLWKACTTFADWFQAELPDLQLVRERQSDQHCNIRLCVRHLYRQTLTNHRVSGPTMLLPSPCPINSFVWKENVKPLKIFQAGLPYSQSVRLWKPTLQRHCVYHYDTTIE